MNISLILGHPNVKSFNYAIYEKINNTLLKKNHSVNSHDLYRENFQPVINGDELAFDKINDKLTQTHCDEIKNADGIIIIHPNWWGQPPAILKGWIDRVLRPEIAYKFAENDNGSGIPDGLLKAKAAIVFNTSNTPLKRELEIFGDPLDSLWKKCIFDFCGIKNFHRKMFSVIADSTPEIRTKWLDESADIINNYF